MARPIPMPRLSAIAERHGLGGFRAIHAGLTDMVHASLGGVALGLFLMSFLVLQPLAGPEYEDDVMMGVVLPAAGACFIVLGIIGYLVTRGRAVQLHEHGLVYKERGTIRSIRYADVIAVTQDITRVSSNTGNSFSGRLIAHLRDGSRVRIRPNIEGLDRVVGALVEEAAPTVVQHVVAQLRAGGTVPSGALTLTPQGIQHGRQLIPFGAVARIHERSDMSFFMDRTRVILEIHGKHGQTPMKMRAGAVLHRSYLEVITRAMTGGRW